MTQQKTLVWFRNDLRVKDNPALHWAAEQGDVLAVFILDSENDDIESLGGASKWWLHHSLHSLDSALDGNLIVSSGDPLTILSELAKRFEITNVVWNRCYDQATRERDVAIKSSLKQREINVKSFNGSLLWEPMNVLKQDGTPYKVFTPYYRKGCLSASPPRYPLESPSTLTFINCGSDENKVESLALLPSLDWADGFSQHWEPGEGGAADKLQRFIRDAAKTYQDERNLPNVLGTSRLSPHLHFGEISPNQAWYAVLDAFGGSDDKNIDTFLSELGWREFSYYLLFHWPSLPESNFNAKFDAFPWVNDDASLEAWQRGQTGIPIIDAGMRELWQTGYMHNRVRMVVGSFLVKNLLQDWRKGAAWFWDCLLDADLAANSASWQWVAGSGADAAPYFRIFNPILQGEKFDKAGDYVTTYCPELKGLPTKYIHKPWEAPVGVLQQAGIKLGIDYPSPIVDLKASRQAALAAYENVKGA